MLTELGSELIVTGFVALIHRLWDLLNREQFSDGFFPLELADMSEKEYQAFVDQYSQNRELN